MNNFKFTKELDIGTKCKIIRSVFVFLSNNLVNYIAFYIISARKEHLKYLKI